MRKKNKKKRNRQTLNGVAMFVLIFTAISVFLAIPVVLRHINLVETMVEPAIDKLPYVGKLIQPRHQNNNDTGPRAPSSVVKSTPDYEGYATVDFW